MKKLITLILSFALVSILLTSCESSSVKIPSLPLVIKQLNLETINWNAKTTDIDKNYNKERADLVNINRTNLSDMLTSTNSLKSSKPFEYVVSVEYDGIKNVTKNPVTVMYCFDSVESLRAVMFFIDDNYLDAFENLKTIAKTIVTDYNGKDRAGYFMHIGNNSVKITESKEEEKLLVTCTESGFVKSATSHESSFSINDIDWNMNRDDIKKLHQNKICHYDEPEEDEAPLGYSFVNLEGIAQNNIPVVYFFNEDNTLKSIVIHFENTDQNWENALKYYNATVSTERKMTVLQNSNTRAALDINEDNEISLFLVSNN